MKKDIREDLLNEYETLGRPGSGKSIQEVIQSVEDEMSKNLTFTLEKAPTGKVVALVCGKTRILLPKGDWKNQIYKDQQGIPFVSTGKQSFRCIHLFREHEESNKEKEGSVKKNSSGSVKMEPLGVPLPGNSVGATPSECITNPGQGFWSESCPPFLLLNNWV